MTPVLYDQSGEIIRKAAEPLTPGGLDNYYIKVALSGPGGVVAPVPVTFAGANAATPSIQNISAPVSPGTEFSFSIPSGAKKFTIRSRLLGELRVAYASGETATKYITVMRGQAHYEDNLLLASSVTVFMTSTKASDTIEVLSWT